MPTRAMELSIVIPIHDEEASIGPLAEEITRMMDGSGVAWECCWVDDGSRDDSWTRLRRLTAPHRAIRLSSNCGQSAAVMAGVHAAQGTWIGVLDGDGQNDPADLLRQLEIARSAGVPLVVGYRATRQDNLVRRISSRLGNLARRLMVGRAGRDAGCSTKIVRRDTFLNLPFFHGMICFMPDLVQAGGGTFLEVPVNHRPRHAGRPKYGIGNRLWVGLVDLLGVRWLLRRQRRGRLSYDLATLDAEDMPAAPGSAQPANQSR
jgi:dolichol-phosphate mannosyltransferase